MERVCLLMAFVSFITQGGWCLRDVRLTVLPAAVQLGRSATLLCRYELEGAPLYSVKWYRGTREFYRHSPSELPANKVFPFTGIYVDEELSNSSQVVLRDVSFALAGNFSCEVTTDAPSFSTAVVSQHMEVIALPMNRPIVNTERMMYEPGDILRANCTSPPSKPPALLSFLINGIPVAVDRTEHRLAWGLEGIPSGSLEWSTASMYVQLVPSHFAIKRRSSAINEINYRPGENTGSLQITCTAHVPIGGYQQSTVLKLGSRLGEPIHQRVMSESCSTSVYLQSFIWIILIATATCAV